MTGVSRPALPDRRRLVAGLGVGLGVAAALRPELAEAAAPERDWLAYAGRLRRGLADPSVRFDPAVEDGLLGATNAFRAQAGTPALHREPELQTVARAAAADLLLRGFFDHRSPEGFAPSSRAALLARSLIGSVAENIAAGHGPPEPTGDNLARFWFDSPGHRANMLQPSHDAVGHGVARRADSFTAVAVFMQVAARLPAPLPLSLQAAALRPALQAASPPVRDFALEPADPGAAHAHGLEPVWGEPPAGFHRLRPLTPDGRGDWLITFGPVVSLR